MSASTRTAPAQLSFGRVPSAFAALALVVILAVVVAIVALNGTKAASVTTRSVGAPPPIGYDHGSSNGETVFLPKAIPHYGGWGGPVLTAPAVGNDGPKIVDESGLSSRLKGPVTLGGPTNTGTGGHNGTRFSR
jgi:hypothetical protein